MTIRRFLRISGTSLCLLLASSNWANAQDAGQASSAPNNDQGITDKRMREVQQKLRQEHQEIMLKMRAQRAALESRLAAERKQESERDRQQAARNATALAAAKETKQRQALEATQAQARKEAEALAAQVERERVAKLKTLRDQEEKFAREQKAAEEAAKKGGSPRLGGETKFGVDL
jgi:hypothetical protein